MSIGRQIRVTLRDLSSAHSTAPRYGLALVFVITALFVSLLLQPLLPDAFLILFLAAVMASGWFGRIGPGLFSVIVSIPTVDYYFIPPRRAFVMELQEGPYFVSFLLSAVVASWLASARKQAEEKQKAHFDELFEQAPEAIMLVDLQDRVLRINKEFTRIFGYASPEAVGRSSIDLIVPAELREQETISRDRLAQGQSVNLETVRSRRDDSLLNVSEMAVPIIAGGERIANYFIFRDITDSKRSAEALQQAKAELAHLSRVTTMGELVVSIAHEVNQPIGAVVTNGNAALRWLAQQPPNLPEVRGALNWIIQDAARAAAVIERIRALVKGTVTQTMSLDANEIIGSVLVLTDNEIRRANINLRTELADLPLVVGDRVQLQQVMLNLIMNGIDAMSTVPAPKRELCIRSLKDTESVLIQVQDSGTGWDVETGARIFDPFFTTKTEGLGMGLTISRSIIEAHGGRLWATLRSPHGATLNFTLPFVEDAS